MLRPLSPHELRAKTEAAEVAEARHGQTLEQYYNNEMRRALGFMKAADGQTTDTARAARGNLITNYRFNEGRLKGFSVGGAVRWRAAPTIGYGVKTTAEGARVLDLDRAFKGRAETHVDFLAAYRARLKAFGGFNYRVQLNIRNLLDEDDPIPVTAISTGAVTRIRFYLKRAFLYGFEVGG